jgi:hypothetical protein
MKILNYKEFLMKKCTICKRPLTNKAMDLTQILDENERKRLEKIRRKRGLCSECSISLVLLSLI